MTKAMKGNRRDLSCETSSCHRSLLIRCRPFEAITFRKQKGASRFPSIGERRTLLPSADKAT